MSDRFTGRRQSRSHEIAYPPTAEETQECPPHYWILEKNIQWCRKCGERRSSDLENAGPISGSVSKIALDRGVGYIKDATGREYFFNRASVKDNGFGDLRVGQQVEFDPGYGTQMGGRALNVRLPSDEQVAVK